MNPNPNQSASPNKSAVHAAPSSQRLNLLHRITGRKINGRAPNLLRLGEPLGHAVDDVHLRRTAQNGGVRRHEPDGACAEDYDGFAGAEALGTVSVRCVTAADGETHGKLDAVPALQIIHITS